jgi:hypothetical protein
MSLTTLFDFPMETKKIEETTEKIKEDQKPTREQLLKKLDKMGFYDQRNEDSFVMFPNCKDCNPNNRVIIIPNNNPIIYGVIKDGKTIDKILEE